MTRAYTKSRGSNQSVINTTEICIIIKSGNIMCNSTSTNVSYDLTVRLTQGSISFQVVVEYHVPRVFKCMLVEADE